MSTLNHSITPPVYLFASLSFELLMWSEWCWLNLPWPYSVSPSFSQSDTFSVFLPIRTTIARFCLSPHAINTEQLDAGACWNLYWTTWSQTQTVSTTECAYRAIYSLADKVSISGIAAICCKQRLEPSSVLEQPKSVYCLLCKIHCGTFLVLDLCTTAHIPDFFKLFIK